MTVSVSVRSPRRAPRPCNVTKRITVQCITLRALVHEYITYSTVQCSTLQYIRLHYITLHYIVLHYLGEHRGAPTLRRRLLARARDRGVDLRVAVDDGYFVVVARPAPYVTRHL